LLAAMGGAAGIVLGAPIARLAAAQRPAAAGTAATVKLSDDLFVLRIPGEANVVAQTGPDGVLLVDGASSQGADALMTAVAALPGAGPVRTLFNTHWHPEQVGSNERLGKAGAAIVAHENTRLWLATDVTWPWNGRRFVRLPTVARPPATSPSRSGPGGRPPRPPPPPSSLSPSGSRRTRSPSASSPQS
jgi:glyoxylase-like metal-dependent hydrolase (beta-lactamase superfamily II)